MSSASYLSIKSMLSLTMTDWCRPQRERLWINFKTKTLRPEFNRYWTEQTTVVAVGFCRQVWMDEFRTFQLRLPLSDICSQWLYVDEVIKVFALIITFVQRNWIMSEHVHVNGSFSHSGSDPWTPPKTSSRGRRSSLLTSLRLKPAESGLILFVWIKATYRRVDEAPLPVAERCLKASV